MQTEIVGTPLSMMAEGGNEGVSSRAFSSLGVAMIGAEKDSVAIPTSLNAPIIDAGDSGRLSLSLLNGG